VNPSTASSQSPLILFTQIGTYTVTLTVVNSCGTFVSTPATILVSGTPTVSFNPNTLTVNKTGRNTAEPILEVE
jgi:PKD repeat protein